MRTYVKALVDIHQEAMKKDEIGYIEGFVRGGDDRPYVVVIHGKSISLVLTYQLEVIGEK